MANTIKLKKSSVAAKVPLAGDLDYGELAINYNDGNLFFKDSSNTIQTIASTQFANVTGNVSGGNIVTAGQVSAAGNVTGGNIVTAGQVSATGNITGGNIATGGIGVFVGNLVFGAEANTRNSGFLGYGTDSFGFTSEFNNAVFLRNEQTTTEQTLYLGDTGTSSTSTLFGIGSGTGNGTPVLTLSGIGNLTVANVTPTGMVSATGNVIGSNLVTAGLVSATGNVAGGNLITAGRVDATGNVTGGNLVTAATVAGADALVSGQLTAGNSTAYDSQGDIIAYGTGRNMLILQTSDNNIDRGLAFRNAAGAYAGAIWVEESTQGVNLGNLVLGVSSATHTSVDLVEDRMVLSPDGNVQMLGNLQVDDAAVVTGNVSGGNIITAGQVSATGNVSGGNITTAGQVSATGNVSGGNLTTAGLISATGNITGGNITTAGAVTATGNVQTSANVVYANAAGSPRAYQFYNSAADSIDTVFI